MKVVFKNLGADIVSAPEPMAWHLRAKIDERGVFYYADRN